MQRGKVYKIMVLGEEKKNIQEQNRSPLQSKCSPKTRNSLNLTFVSGAFGVLLPIPLGGDFLAPITIHIFIPWGRFHQAGPRLLLYHD